MSPDDDSMPKPKARIGSSRYATNKAQNLRALFFHQEIAGDPHQVDRFLVGAAERREAANTADK